MAHSSTRGLLTLLLYVLILAPGHNVCVLHLQDNDSLFAGSMDGGINRGRGQKERRVCSRVMLLKCWDTLHVSCLCLVAGVLNNKLTNSTHGESRVKLSVFDIYLVYNHCVTLFTNSFENCWAILKDAD